MCKEDLCKRNCTELLHIPPLLIPYPIFARDLSSDVKTIKRNNFRLLSYESVKPTFTLFFIVTPFPSYLRDIYRQKGGGVCTLSYIVNFPYFYFPESNRESKEHMSLFQLIIVV